MQIFLTFLKHDLSSLFSRMTGVGGRPEVIIEGSDEEGKWQEYNFLYKPGDVNRRPPIVGMFVSFLVVANIIAICLYM